MIPPMVVISGKDLANGEVPNTLYDMSKSGWMDQELFADWFSKNFLKHDVSSRPLLLMLDGHSSHYHRLQLSRNLRDSPGFVDFVPGPGGPSYLSRKVTD